MEVKVTCPCGTNYKFDVEPVNKRMPWPVNCPDCGADGTAQANEIIRQALSPPQPPAAPAPPPVVRVSRAAPAPAPPPIAAAPPFPPPPRAPVPPPSVVIEQAPPKSNRAGWAIMAGVFLLAAFLGYRLVTRMGSVLSAVATVTEADEKDNGEHHWNLTADDEIVVYLKHTNEMEVADECSTWFHQKLHRNLRRTKPEEDDGQGHVFTVVPPQGGYVLFAMSKDELKDAEFEELTGHLSEKFNTLAFVEKDVDFTGEYVFGVYEQGTNQFYARHDVAMPPAPPGETRTTRGNDWALAHGYKAGTNGFKKFSIRDADMLTQNCGMRLWTRDEESVTNVILLKEWGMTGGQ